MKRSEIATSLGTLSGTASAGSEAFLGIPYAAPPVGPLRFEPPQPADPWRGIRECSAHGPAPCQAADGLSLELGLLAPHPQSEDCLTLNVWRPAKPARERRPVMVWLHGGAFASGHAAGPAYQGAALARRGGVIVVTLNYRVGALGFLHLGGGRSNLGLQDQIAALRFVQREIAAFGGDPARVTVFGESAGAGSIVALLAMPAARGLFARAIVQSAAPEGQLSAEEGAARAKLLGEQLGGDASDLAWLRALPAERIVAAQSACAEPGPRRIGMLFAPVVDGETLPEPPLAAIARGAAHDVALVVGTTADEMRLFQLVPSFGAPPESALAALVASRLPGAREASAAAARRIVAAYAGEATPLDRFLALETDASLFVPSTRLAEAQSRVQPRTFMYRFIWRSPLRGGALGACHALDVPFALGTHAEPPLRAFAGEGRAAHRLAHAVMDAWSAFARSGDPAHGGIPEWPRYEPRRRATLELGDPCRLVDAPNEERRRLWAAAREELAG